MGTFVRHIPCESCGSSDANALYADNTTYCWACTEYGSIGVEEGDMADTNEDAVRHTFIVGSYQDIPNRGLTAVTCEKYGYEVADDYGGAKCHVANYRDPKTGMKVAQKIRHAGKRFAVQGGGKGMPMFGQHLWGSGGKSVVITEGEIDALSVAQAFNCKWPVVSLPNGAQSAMTAIKNAWEWLVTFDKIVLCFDMDAPGREACELVAQELPPGKAFIMRMPDGYKDANDVLVKLGTAPLTQAYWNATPYRPDGIVALSDLREAITNPKVTPSVPYPWMGLQSKLKGIRKGEVVTLTSGSGLGKSTLLKELTYHLAVGHGKSVGGMFLEESNQRTVESLIGIHLNKNIVVDREIASASEIAGAFDFLCQSQIYLWDHFGSNEIEEVLKKIRYMAKVQGVEYLFLDHLSILISGLDVGDERRTIDVAMTKLRTLVSELNIGMFLVSHLRRPQGDRGHEEGAEVSLGQLRGSHSIAQLSDAVIGLQKDRDDPGADTLQAVVLKNRLSGDRGLADTLTYNRVTGRLMDGI